MSEDPQTRERLAALDLGGPALVVLDVDEVVLEFVAPFTRFLQREGFQLKPHSFRLTGNIFEVASGAAVDRQGVGKLLDRFFAEQADWQTPAQGATAAIARLSQKADIVLLTAMPHRHFAARKGLLERCGITAPLVTTETAKGPAIAAMRRADVPVVFVDDLPGNLLSARERLADIRLVHLMAHAAFRSLLPPMPEGVDAADDWAHATAIIETALRS